MKILSVTVIPPGEDAQWWRISNIAKELNLKNCDVDLVHYIVKGGISHNIINKKKVELFSKESIKIASPLSLFIYHFKKVTANKYDLVYGNTYGGTFFCILGKLKGIPLVLDLHGISEEIEFDSITKKKKKYIQYLITKFIECVSLHLSDKIICVSNKMIDYLHTEKKIPLNKMIYGTSGVDLDFFRPTESKQILNEKKHLGIESKFVFGYIGAFQAYQGVDKLLETATKIHDDRVIFLFVGGDKKSREDNIIFIPKVLHDRVPIYYSMCHVLVLPRPFHIATEVAAPTKFAEYCAMGKPILTTDVGDAADLVRKYKNGIVIENNSPEYLEKGILEFLNLDPDALVEMGKRSRQLAESEFDWKKVSSNIIAGLENLNK